MFTIEWIHIGIFFLLLAAVGWAVSAWYMWKDVTNVPIGKKIIFSIFMAPLCAMLVPILTYLWIGPCIKEVWRKFVEKYESK